MFRCDIAMRNRLNGSQERPATEHDSTVPTSGGVGESEAGTAARWRASALRVPSRPHDARHLADFPTIHAFFLYVGAPDRALDYREDSLKIGNALVATLPSMWGQPYASIRKTDRFKTFIRKAGLVDYWRARGWPDLCRPMGADDFVCD